MVLLTRALRSKKGRLASAANNHTVKTLTMALSPSTTRKMKTLPNLVKLRYMQVTQLAGNCAVSL